jgi:exosome complex RNA-binding protein Rrp42 (RNase PH superfamily)
MNFDILQKAIPEESLRAFLEKDIRYDNRKFYESRKFNFAFGVLNNYKYSAIGSLGLNKILLVLKETEKKINQDQPKVNIIIDDFESEKKPKKLYDFVEKIMKNNLIYEKNDIKEKIEYNLFITIESIDGNIYEVIAKSLIKFFSQENKIGIIFNKQFESKTICFINGNILFDPMRQETELADFICNIIKYKENNKFFIHKISGLSINIKLIKEALLQMDNTN